MNLKRDIYQTLLSWKNEINHQPLMVIGQAQVGKTFIVRQFANEQYQKLIELDFLEQPQFSKYFENYHGFEDLLTTWINDFKLDRD